MAAEATLYVESIVFSVPGGSTNLQSTAKRYKSNVGMSDNGLTLLFAHCLGSHKEQWEPTIQRIFQLQDGKRGCDRIREAWAFDWPSHGDAAIVNEEVLRLRDEPVSPEEWANAIDYFIRWKLKGHRIVAFGHSAGVVAIMMVTKKHPPAKPPYSAVFVIEPTMISQEIFDEHIEERTKAANMSKQATLERRDVWPDKDTAAAYLRRRLPWKSWDSRVFDIYINEGLRGITAPDGHNMVTLKTSKEQEGLAYPQFTPYIEAISLYKQLCPVIPLHLIFGTTIDFVPLYMQGFLYDSSKGCHPASVTHVQGAGHLIIQEKPDSVAAAICKNLEGKKPQVSSRL